MDREYARPLDVAARVRMAPKSVWRRLASLRRRGLLPARPRRPRPFVSPEDLSSYRRDIRRALREDRAVCLECGRLLRSVASHLKVHGLTAGAYREKWGYNRRRGLVNRATHDLMSNRALARGVSRLASRRRTLKDGDGRRVSRTPRRLEMRLDQHDRMRARLATGWRPPVDKKADDDTLRALAAAAGGPDRIASWCQDTRPDRGTHRGHDQSAPPSTAGDHGQGQGGPPPGKGGGKQPGKAEPPGRHP